MKVINIFGGPGAGKSTTAAAVFVEMKKLGLNVELVAEFAKDIVWERHIDLFRDQLFITANQNRRLERLRGQVEYAVSDSPVLLGLLYEPKEYYSYYNLLVREIFESYNNVNFFIKRTKPYAGVGRLQTKFEAEQLDVDLLKMLFDYKIPYTELCYTDNSIKSVEKIIKEVITLQ